MMLNTPQISVLMPAYNCQDFIGQAIESIQCQTSTHWELIILDDHSQDKTYSIAQKYAQIDKRIKVFKNSKNLNIAATRNKLISLAHGDFIAWQDADDQSSRDRLELQYKLLHSKPKVAIVGGYLKFIHPNNKTSIRKYATNDQEIRHTIFRFSPVAQPVAMIRKYALLEVGEYGVDLPPAEDIDMSFRLGVNYQFANIPKVLLNYRDHPGSATYKKLKKIELVTLKTRLKYFFHPSYPTSIIDLLYNLLQFLTIFLIPTKMRIKLFNLIRNQS